MVELEHSKTGVSISLFRLCGMEAVNNFLTVIVQFFL